MEAPRLPAAFFNDSQNQDPGKCSIVGPIIYVKKKDNDGLITRNVICSLGGTLGSGGEGGGGGV